jgi:multicomponent Na+:H+ antiporter subunit D
MIGVPPTCGFFSKWYLILGAIEAGRWGFMIALIFSSLVNAVLFFRVIEVAFFEERGGHGGGHGSGHDAEPVDEAPLTMLIPLLVVAGALIAIGLGTGEIVESVIRFTVPAGIPS